MAAHWKQILINFFKYGLLGFMSLVIIMNLYLGINKAITHNPVPDFMGVTPLIVLSGSMEPAIMPGDMVIIRKQTPDQYKIGDIATYQEGATTFTHRIVAEADGAFVLKGDNNNVADDTVSAEQFIGKMIIRIPFIGIAILFFKTPPGMLVLLILLTLIIYGEELYEKIRRKPNRYQASAYD